MQQALATLMWVKIADPVRPGYWLARRRVGPRGSYGPLVPAAIILIQTDAEPERPDNFMERSPFYAGFFAGEPVSVWALQQATHATGEMIIRREREIDRAEYLYRLADLAWAKQHAPDEPAAQPHRAVNLMQARLPF